MKRSAAKNIAQDNAEQENITQSNTENATIARGKGKAVSTVYRSHSSCELHQNSAEWDTGGMILHKWACPPVNFEKYTLCELIIDYDTILNGYGGLTCSEDAFVLCIWLIRQVGITTPIVSDNIYTESKEVEVCYVLDHNEFFPIAQILQPFICSSHFKCDVGLVVNGLLAFCMEINSSPMEKTVAKLAANLIDLLRFIRHFDTNITEIEGFAFPNNATKNYVSKVTVEWKHLRFYVNENIYPLKAQIINAVKSTYERQCSIAKKLTLCPNPVKYSVPYSDADLEMLQQLLIQQQQQLVLVQKESAFSLLFEDGAFYYKFSPYPSANRTLTILERKPKTADGPLVLPIKVLTVLDSMLFFVFDAQDYQFELLNWEELLSCLFHIASGVKLALDALHGLGFAHTDVRINNACFHNNQVTLIDFDRATSCTNTVTTSNHFMYNNQGGREMTSVCDLDWKQLGLMILSIITSTTQTQLTIDDVNAQDEDSVVRCLVFDYNWNAAAANHLPKEKDILSVFQRKSTGEDGRQPKREALGEGAPEERS